MEIKKAVLKVSFFYFSVREWCKRESQLRFKYLKLIAVTPSPFNRKRLEQSKGEGPMFLFGFGYIANAMEMEIPVSISNAYFMR